MATNEEIEEQVNIALSEIGPIKPWFDKNFNAKASSRKPRTTFMLLSHPPDFGRLFKRDGNKANKVNGNARAREKPNIPIAGPNRSPFEAASTNKDPIIGPVQEKDTTTNVEAIKNITTTPPLSEF